jgi:hypothetical protein
MEESSHVEEGLRGAKGRRRAAGDNTRNHEFPCASGIFSELSGFRETSRSSEGSKSGGKGRESNFRHKIQITITTPTPTRTNTNTNNSQQHIVAAAHIISFNRHRSSRMNAQRLQ